MATTPLPDMQSHADSELDPRLLEHRFATAVEIIANLPNPGPIQPSNEEKLTFYALYKQATTGPCMVNTPQKPAFWDVVARAKWDAWSRLGNMSPEKSKEVYVAQLIKILQAHPEIPETKGYIEDLTSLTLPPPSPEFSDAEAEDYYSTTRSQTQTPFGERPTSSQTEELSIDSTSSSPVPSTLNGRRLQSSMSIPAWSAASSVVNMISHNNVPQASSVPTGAARPPSPLKQIAIRADDGPFITPSLPSGQPDHTLGAPPPKLFTERPQPTQLHPHTQSHSYQIMPSPPASVKNLPPPSPLHFKSRSTEPTTKPTGDKMVTEVVERLRDLEVQVAALSPSSSSSNGARKKWVKKLVTPFLAFLFLLAFLFGFKMDKWPRFLVRWRTLVAGFLVSGVQRFVTNDEHRNLIAFAAKKEQH